MQGKIEPTDDEREELQIDVRQQVAQELEPELREQITNEAQIRLLLATADQNAASAQNSLAAAALKQDEAAEIAAKVEKITVETEKILEDKVNAALDGMSKMLDNFAKQSGLGMPITIREHDQHVQQSDQIDDEQQDVDGGPTSEQEEQFNLPQQ
jgi:SpoVK/Ycf46/Vps4 family AAA+-type ATPase